jgi:hypothetical protein
MEIKEGMYFRTNTGIRRVVYINDGCITFDDFMSNGTSLFNFIEEKELDMYLTKEPSFNIIDLVEEGDLVNGIIVDEINTKFIDKGKEFTMIFRGTEIAMFEEDIKTILTHEQIATHSYKLGDDK